MPITAVRQRSSVGHTRKDLDDTEPLTTASRCSVYACGEASDSMGNADPAMFHHTWSRRSRSSRESSVCYVHVLMEDVTRSNVAVET